MLDLLLFAFLNLLGTMSPGPDFALVTRYGLTGSKRAAIFASLGIGSALLIHVFYCVSGIAIFLHSTPQILNWIQFFGAIYLGYLGLKIFSDQKSEPRAEKEIGKNAFVTGFFTNLLNPKATVFLVSLFSQFAHAMSSFGMKLAFALSIPLIAVSWFTILSHFLTHSYFLPFLQKNRRKFMVSMGVFLCLLSVSGFISVFMNFSS
jgi:threonine/homoserine/homoserine lactone efflux protein